MATDRPILLVEDNPDDEALTLRAFSKNKIANQVVVARDGVEALDYLFCTGQYSSRDGSVMPAFVLLDLKLPRIDGLEVLRRMRKTSAVPVILLTARDAVMEKVNGLDLGANDYITKPFHIEELLARIRMVLRATDSGAQNGGSDALTLGDLALSPASRKVTRAGETIELTKTQYDLLEYLLRNRDIVLTRDQILAHVWGYTYAGNSNVVDVYVRYLRGRIHDSEESRIIETIRGIGYVIRDKTRKE